MTVGSVLGLAAGYGMAMSRRDPYRTISATVAILSVVLGVFLLSNALAHESGLTAVTVMGVYLANAGLKQLREVLYFKEKLSILLLSVLFILLAAHVTRTDLAMLDWNSVVLLPVVMFVLRPVGRALSTLGSNLGRNERLLLGWIAPRGIVAASVSSLFAFLWSSAASQRRRSLHP